MTFDVGDKVVYPHHGAATIERREKKEVFGEKRDYLVLRLAYGDLTLMVPADNAEEIGLRDVINDEEVEEVFAVLRKKEARMPTNWSRRFKNHVEKLKSGDIYQVAEVVRNLSIREADKGLSAGEKRMLARARQILVSELTFALNVDEETAEARLDDGAQGRGPAAGAGEEAGQEGRRQEVAAARWPCCTPSGRSSSPPAGASASGARSSSPTSAARASSTTPSRTASHGVRRGRARASPTPSRRGTAPRSPRSSTGGATRSESVRAGLAAVPPDAEVVVVHDAARPLATAALFDAVIDAVRAGADGAVPGLPVADTLKRVDDVRVIETVDRVGLVAVQTPQAFRAGVLRAAHAPAADATDDAALVEALGGTVVVVPGDPAQPEGHRRRPTSRSPPRCCEDA